MVKYSSAAFLFPFFFVVLISGLCVVLGKIEDKSHKEEGEDAHTGDNDISVTLPFSTKVNKILIPKAPGELQQPQSRNKGAEVEHQKALNSSSQDFHSLLPLTSLTHPS